MTTLSTCGEQRCPTVPSRHRAPQKKPDKSPRHTPAAARAVVLLVAVSVAASGCVRGADKGWGRDMQNQWYAYCLSGWFTSRDTLDFLAVSRKKFKQIKYSIGEYGPGTVAVEGVKYRFPPSWKVNLYLVWEDGTVYCSAYRMTADEFREFERQMEKIEHSDVLEGLKRTLDGKKLDKETRKFLGIE
jgi:hypothetical protein